MQQISVVALKNPENIRHSRVANIKENKITKFFSYSLKKIIQMRLMQIW